MAGTIYRGRDWGEVREGGGGRADVGGGLMLGGGEVGGQPL